jgi:hypothetical protein
MGWEFGVETNSATPGDPGYLVFEWSSSGGVGGLTKAKATKPLPAYGQRIQVAVEFSPNNGGVWQATFWISQDGGRTWGVVDTVVGGASASIFDSSQPVEVGTRMGGGWPYYGKYYRFQIWNEWLISNPSGATRAQDFYPAKMDRVMFNAGRLISKYTGEEYTTTDLTQYKFTSGFRTEMRDCYIATGGFTSQAWDVPAQQYYPPWVTKSSTMSRSMGVALSGKANTGIGALTVSNPVGTSGGARDKWLRMKWRRDFVRQLLGDPSWSRADFRTVVIGRLGQPTADASGITFPISDLSDVMNEPLQANLYTSGDLTGKPKPIYVGRGAYIEPPCTNVSSQEYQIHDGPMANGTNEATFPGTITELYDNFTSIVSVPNATTTQIAAVNTATETLTTTAPHGMAAGGTYTFASGTPPTPFVAGTAYYVIAAGLTASDFRLAATPGGVAINITSATTGANGYYSPSTLYAYKGIFTLARSPAGRVVCMTQGAKGTDTGDVADIVDYLVFKKFALSQDFRDATVFTNIKAAMPVGNYKAAYFIPPQAGNVLARDALLKFTQGCFLWYGFTTDGLFKAGKLALPTGLTANAVQTFVESDVKLDSLRLTNRLLPINFDKVPVTYGTRFLNGAANTNNPFFSLPNFALGPYTIAASGIPLDGVPWLSDQRSDVSSFDLLMIDSSTGSNLQGDLTVLFSKMLGVFEFYTKLRAMTLNIGDEISLTHSKEEWKLFYSGDKASPDDSGVHQSNAAVVLGVDVDLNASNFPVKLTCFRQIPGYYPTTDVNSLS